MTRQRCVGLLVLDARALARAYGDSFQVEQSPKFFDAETSGWNVAVQGPQEVSLVAAVRPADVPDPEPDDAPPGKTELPPNYYPTVSLDSQ